MKFIIAMLCISNLHSEEQIPTSKTTMITLTISLTRPASVSPIRYLMTGEPSSTSVSCDLYLGDTKIQSGKIEIAIPFGSAIESVFSEIVPKEMGDVHDSIARASLTTFSLMLSTGDSTYATSMSCSVEKLISIISSRAKTTLALCAAISRDVPKMYRFNFGNFDKNSEVIPQNK
jgi:hypothetical protein